MSIFFFFNDTATTEIYTLSLHDALPIYVGMVFQSFNLFAHKTILDNVTLGPMKVRKVSKAAAERSEEHTSELQSRQYLVCRLLLEKKKITHIKHATCEQHISPLLHPLRL